MNTSSKLQSIYEIEQQLAQLKAEVETEIQDIKQ